MHVQAKSGLGKQDYDEALGLESTCCQALVRKGKVLLALKKEEVRPALLVSEVLEGSAQPCLCAYEACHGVLLVQTVAGLAVVICGRPSSGVLPLRYT